MRLERMTVRIRRCEGWQVKPWAEKIDGKTYSFRKAWDITKDDSSIYAGEQAMQPIDETYPFDAPAWIASGDLISVGQASAS